MAVAIFVALVAVVFVVAVVVVMTLRCWPADVCMTRGLALTSEDLLASELGCSEAKHELQISPPRIILGCPGQT